MDALLANADALVLPTLPITAPLLGADDITIDPAVGDRTPVRAAMLKHTQPFNMSGHPAISLPVPSAGLPVGLQIRRPPRRHGRALGDRGRLREDHLARVIARAFHAWERRLAFADDNRIVRPVRMGFGLAGPRSVRAGSGGGGRRPGPRVR